MTERSILLVEDDTSLSYVLSLTLEKSGYQVVSVLGGNQAVERYRQDAFDLALVDLMLPDTDGLQVMEEILAYDPGAKVVIMTAFGEKETAVRAFRLGAVEYLEKPFDNQTLLETVEKTVSREESGLQGDLRMMSLASIIQINCEERNQSRLRIRGQGKEGLIYFNHGEVVHSEVGELQGNQAVYELLSWESGTFQLEMDVSSPVRTINTRWSGLLMEGMRRIDETGEGLDPDWEEEPAEEENVPRVSEQERIAKALTRISGVEGVMICCLEGELLLVERESLPEQQPELTKFLVRQAISLGEIINGRDPKRLILKGKNSLTLLAIWGSEIIHCQLSTRSSLDAVWNSFQTTMKRYRSNHRGG